MSSEKESRLDTCLLAAGALLSLIILFYPFAYFAWLILTAPD